MINSYLAERNYVLLYLYNMLYRGSTSVVHVFTGAHMVSVGMPLWSVLAFYAATAFLAGALAPAGLAIITRMGVPKTAVLSLVLRLIFFLLFLGSDGDIQGLGVAVLFYGLSYAVYPFNQVVEAVYVTKDKYRGRQMTMSLVLAGFMSAFAIAAAGYLLIHVGYIGIAVLSSFFYLCAVLTLSFMTAEDFHVADYRMIDGYKFARSRHLRGIKTPIISEQLVVSAGMIVPVYLFTVVGDMATFGIIATAAVVLEIIATLVFGQVIDKKRSLPALYQGSAMMAGSFIAMLFVSSPLSALFADSFTKISRNSFSSAFRTALHKLVRMGKSKQLLMQGTAWQLIAGVCESIYLLLLALLAFYAEEKMFTVAFICCALGAVSTAWFFARKYQKERFK